MLSAVSIARATGFLAMFLTTGVPLSAAGALLSGCAHGPVLSDSVERLSEDARAVLAAGTERLGPPGAQPRVLLDATRPCRGGQAQHVFKADLPLQPGATARVVADRATDLSLELIRARGYHLDGPPHHHVFSMSYPAPPVSLTMRVYGGNRPIMELAGITPCLPAD